MRLFTEASRAAEEVLAASAAVPQLLLDPLRKKDLQERLVGDVPPGLEEREHLLGEAEALLGSPHCIQDAEETRTVPRDRDTAPHSTNTPAGVSTYTEVTPAGIGRGEGPWWLAWESRSAKQPAPFRSRPIMANTERGDAPSHIYGGA